uniref:Uncharacterized protein n=1 Tax=Mucochytrium quahogii TaxID=96639 RepID=A0A7S2RHZ1_9STRA|mmetsp:Transcript_1540/g.3207  ORF Transcript_1540/g.3207 Transcript_1540/m.3207 type:complete len:497 (+) Transcript_1540:258-1748(+)
MGTMSTSATRMGTCPCTSRRSMASSSLWIIFLQCGADPNATGQRNNTCLHFAAAKGHIELVKFFISLGLSPLAKNDLGNTPYDSTQAFGIRQLLMPLMFQEEKKLGISPEVLGATRDSTATEHLKNLAPPPKMGEVQQQMQQLQTPSQGGLYAPPPHPGLGYQQQASPAANTPSPAPTAQPGVYTPQPVAGGGAPFNPASASATPPIASGTPPPAPVGTPPVGGTSTYVDPNYRPPSRGRKIQADGFVTTVGNPSLAAKYGNTSKYRPADADTDATGGSVSPPTYNPELAKQSPFAKGRYVTYNAGNDTSAPFNPSTSQYQGAANPGVQRFTPQQPAQSSQPVQTFNPAMRQQASPVQQQTAPGPGQNSPSVQSNSPVTGQFQQAQTSPHNPSPVPGQFNRQASPVPGQFQQTQNPSPAVQGQFQQAPSSPPVQHSSPVPGQFQQPPSSPPAQNPSPVPGQFNQHAPGQFQQSPAISQPTPSFPTVPDESEEGSFN